MKPPTMSRVNVRGGLQALSLRAMIRCCFVAYIAGSACTAMAQQTSPKWDLAIRGLNRMLDQCESSDHREAIMRFFFGALPSDSGASISKLRPRYQTLYESIHHRTQARTHFCGTSDAAIFYIYTDMIPKSESSQILTAMNARTESQDQTLETLHFRIHYALSGVDAVPPEFATALAEHAEFTWKTQVDSWGYRASHGWFSDRYEVYIQKNPSGLFGGDPGSHFDWKTKNIVIGIDNVNWNSADTSHLLVVFAHEFHHACQEEYVRTAPLVLFGNAWATEGSARWMQHETMRAHPLFGDKSSEPLGMMSSDKQVEWEWQMFDTLDDPRVDLWTKDRGYGFVAFWYFLADNLPHPYSGDGDRVGVNRRFWQYLSDDLSRNARAALERTISLGPAGANTFPTSFAANAKAYSTPYGGNWFDVDVSRVGYWDGASYGSNIRVFRRQVTDLPISVSIGNLNGASFANTVLLGDRRERVKVSVDGDDSKAFFAYALVCGDGDGNTRFNNLSDTLHEERMFQLTSPSETATEDHILLDPAEGRDGLVVVIGKVDDGPASCTVTIDRATDNTPPSVVSHREETVRNGNAYVTFSEEMELNSFSGTTVGVFGSSTGYHNCSYQLNATTNWLELTLDPVNDFEYGELVTVNIGTGVKDLAGNGIASPYSFSYTISSAPPSVTVLSPNGGESWSLNTTRTITWTTTNVTGNVKIEMSRNNGSSWETLFADTANDGSEKWTVTGSTTTQALIRVKSVSNSAVNDKSDSIFTISAGTTPPESVIENPKYSNRYYPNQTIQIGGTVTDYSGAGIDWVNFTLQRQSGGYYWTGSDWTPNQTWDSTALWTYGGITSWYQSVSINGWEPGSYFVRSKARDKAGNIETPGLGISFNIIPLPTVTVSATDPIASEAGLDSGMFTFYRTGDTANSLFLEYSISGTGRNDWDYNGIVNSITIPAGASSANVSITPKDDALFEGDETVILTVSPNVSYTIGSQTSATVTIKDNEALPQITIGDASIIEENGNSRSAEFVLRLSHKMENPVTVEFFTEDGTARSAENDYQAKSGTVTFSANTDSQMLPITVLGDNLTEDDETFFVNLRNAQNALIFVGRARGTIINDDGLPQVSVDDVTVQEGNEGTVEAVFTVSLSTTYNYMVTVEYSTADGTAKAGSDYIATSGGLVFIPGQRTQTVPIAIIGERSVEPDENFYLNLSNPSNAAITDGQGTGTIRNDDQAPTLTLSSGTITFIENEPPMVIDASATVTDPDSSNFNTGTLTVDFSANGAADDRLEIRNQGTTAGEIGVSGSSVTYGGTTIGTFSGGEGTTPLIVTFNGNSSPASAQALVRNITFRNVSDIPTTSPRTVRFVITDGDDGTSNEATKTINVTAVNDKPVANDQSITTDASIPKLITLTGSDTEGSPLTFAIVTQPTKGQLTGVAPNVSYRSTVGSSGPDFFTFTVTDDQGLPSEIAKVDIEIVPLTFTLTLGSTPSGASFLVNPPDRNGKDTGTSFSYDAGRSVTLTSGDMTGYSFTKWTGDVVSGDATKNPVTLVMDANRSLTAGYDQDKTVWDAHEDFGGPDNPHGAWKYGYKTVNLYSYFDGSTYDSAQKRWDWKLLETYSDSLGVGHDGYVGVDPDLNRDTVLVWTAPYDGTYSLTGEVMAVPPEKPVYHWDSWNGVLVQILRGENGTPVVPQFLVNRDAPVHSLSGVPPLSLLKGEQLVLEVNTNGGSTDEFDTTAVKLTITQTQRNAYSISGTVSLSGTTHYSGVRVSIGRKWTTTGQDGKYTFGGLDSGSYTVTAMKAEYTFGDQPVILGPDATGVDLIGTPNTYSISGTVTLNDSADASGVKVEAGGKSVTIAADGKYTITGLISGTYTAKASKAGYTFPDQNVTLGPDKTGVNFTGVPITVQFTSVSQSSIEEKDTLVVTAQLSAVSSQPVTVPFTLSGTATKDTDYTITASPITIPAGQTTGAINIVINSDTIDEADEKVIVTMDTPTNATQGATTVHTATITDDDETPTLITDITGSVCPPALDLGGAAGGSVSGRWKAPDGVTTKLVVGFRDSSGNWVGGEPQVVSSGRPGQGGDPFSGSFSNLAAPATTGSYYVWAYLALADSDSQGIADFKTQKPVSLDSRNQRIGTPVSVGITTFTSINGTVSSSGVETGKPVGGSVSGRWKAPDGGTANLVIGFRDSSGNWVGGEPQIVSAGRPGQGGDPFSGSFSNLTAPVATGSYYVWAYEALTSSCSDTITDFKSQKPVSPNSRNQRLGSPVNAGYTAITDISGSVSPTSVTVGGSVNGNVSGRWVGPEGAVTILIVGFRDSSGKWVGGEPQEAVPYGQPGQGGDPFRGDFRGLTVPTTPGSYSLWAYEAVTYSDWTAKAEFKSQMPPTLGNARNHAVGTPVSVGVATFTSIVGSVCPLSVDIGGATVGSLSGRWKAPDGATVKLVIGFRDGSGNWVGDEPKVVCTGKPGQSGDPFSGSFNSLTSPIATGSYGVWAYLALADSDSQAVAAFKSQMPASANNRNQKVGSPVTVGATVITSISGTISQTAVEPEGNVSGSVSGRWIAPDDATAKLVVGFRDDSGKWVGGEPQIVCSGTPKQSGDPFSGSFRYMNAPSTAGTYYLWAYEALASTCSDPIADFKSQKPATNNARNQQIPTPVVVASTASCTPTTVTIGTGTSSTYSFPMGTYYHDERTQVIYLASEIGRSGTISSLALDVTTIPGQSMNNWTIRMKHTTLSSYSASAWEGTGWTTVYQGNEPPGSAGWRTFNFTTPFTYDGISNLMVDFSFNNNSWSSYGGCRYTMATSNRTLYDMTDSWYGDPLAWSGTSNPTPYTSKYVPNLKLTICAPSSVAAVTCVTEPTPGGGNREARIDMVLSALSVSTNPLRKGRVATFFYTVTNQGDNPAAKLTFQLSHNGQLVGKRQPIPALAPGEEYSGKVSVEIDTNASSGDYLVTGTVSTVPGETNTANNSATVKVTVK